MIYRLVYFTKELLKNIYSNFFIYLLTITGISLAFTICNIYLIMVININTFLKDWSLELSKFSVYIKEGVPEYLIEYLRSEVESFDGVNKITYLSKEASLSIFKNDFSNYSEILNGFDSNPLPASLEVEFDISYLYDYTYKEYIASFIKSNPLVEDVLFSNDWIKGFLKVSILIKVIGILLGLGIIITTLIISGITIKLSAYLRNDEIEIMKLLGATKRFIKFPFIIEGFLQGGIGASFSIIFSFAFFYIIRYIIFQQGEFSSLIDKISFLPTKFIVIIVLLGGIFGFIGSNISLRKVVNV